MSCTLRRYLRGWGIIGGHLVHIIMFEKSLIITYDHRSVRTGHPVRSAIHKH